MPIYRNPKGIDVMPTCTEMQVYLEATRSTGSFLFYYTCEKKGYSVLGTFTRSQYGNI